MSSLTNSSHRSARKRKQAKKSLVIAPSGMGKTLRFKRTISELIGEGKKVVVIDSGRSYEQFAELHQDKAIFHTIDASDSEAYYEFKQLTILDFESALSAQKSMSKLAKKIIKEAPNAVFIEELCQYRKCANEVCMLIDRFPNDITVSLMSFHDISLIPLDMDRFDEISIHGEIENYHLTDKELSNQLNGFGGQTELLNTAIKNLAHKHGCDGYIDLIDISRNGFVSERLSHPATSQ